APQPQPATDLGAQQHRLAALRRNGLRQGGEQFGAVAGVAPGAAIPAEVEAAGARRDPDLARRAVPVDDPLGALRELDLAHAPALHLEVRVDAACLAAR